MSPVNRTRALALDVQGAAFHMASSQARIHTAAEAQAQIDARSDAHFWEVARILSLIERNPDDAVNLARVAKVHQANGLQLDQLEDDHRDTIVAEATDTRSWAQRVAGWVDAYFGVRGAGELSERRAS